MGSSEMEKSSKDTKEAKETKTPTSQEHASSTNPGIVSADWSGFQAYSPLPPHGFLASSPQAHPYMWGVQPIMPPYGTPHPYVAMYPHGGIYAHPSIPPGSYPFSPFAMPSPNGIAEASGNTPGSVEVDGKPSEGKEKLSVKRSKGSLGSLNMITGRNSDPVNASEANGVCSQSAESASEGSEGSDANSQNDSSQMRSETRQDSLEEASQNGNAPHGSQNGPTMIPHPMAIMSLSTTSAHGGIPGPTTNLNIGMDYWGATVTSSIPAMHGKVTSAPVSGGMVPTGSREGSQSQLWIQDERELKRQKRKQSNRESARRSRLRKQEEYDELAQRAEVLKEENATLRAQVNRIRSEYDLLLAQNASLKERHEVPGQDYPRSSVGKDIQQTGNS